MDRNVSSLAIVLHSQRYGQLNRRLKLLSVDLGIIDVISYGAQKSLKAVKAEVFTDGQFFLYYNPVKKDYSLKDIEVLTTHEALRSDLFCTYAALFFCEMMIKTQGGDSRLEYLLLSKALDQLNADQALVDRTIIQFVHRISDLLGLRGDLLHCPICDRSYGVDEVISFNAGLSSPCCQECASLDADLVLPPGARRYLTLTASMEFEQAVAVQLSPTATLRIKNYMLRYAMIISGGVLKTLNSGVLQENL